jgi:hypothetical protein
VQKISTPVIDVALDNDKSEIAARVVKVCVAAGPALPRL